MVSAREKDLIFVYINCHWIDYPQRLWKGLFQHTAMINRQRFYLKKRVDILTFSNNLRMKLKNNLIWNNHKN